MPETLDNSWVVLYNPYLLRKYDCYINIEIYTTINAVKYFFKYIYKGNDRATVAMENRNNKIKYYLSNRYIGPIEAVWNIMGFRHHNETPPVTRLQVHEQGQQIIYFLDNATQQELNIIRQNPRSTLNAWFTYNSTPEDSRKFLYRDFPSRYIYKDGMWKARQRGFAVKRLLYTSPISDICSH